MASLQPGFEYDIFISYRQKDNKLDRWVSEFVKSLKSELEATFKEDISIYFDENPHNGLLETHDVDASLKEKLKCLIFIPIISRTYCDPKSFAWEHEFKAFIEQASNDQYRLKIKLPNGNVASRVLPVRIHDLDVGDIKMCESVLGGAIRGVDFVFKEPGVNRPLTKEDDKMTNQAGTKYRNQINKTANAIKEIISGLKPEPVKIPDAKSISRELWEEIRPETKQEDQISSKMGSRMSVKKLIILLMAALSVAGAFAIYKIINPYKINKTIAVYFLPEIKNDTVLKAICDIYTETIHEKLLAVRKLIVRPRSALARYSLNEKSLKTIRKDLDINYFLKGEISREGNYIMIWIELSSTKAEKELWSHKYIWEKNLIAQNCNEIVQIVARNLKAKLTTYEINKIETELTNNVDARLNYAIGNSISYQAWCSYSMANKYVEFISFISAIKTYDKAIKEDTLFAQAYVKRAIARAWGYYTRQVDSTHIGKCLEDIRKASEINKDLPEIQIALGFYYYYCRKDLDKALVFFGIAADKSPKDYEPLFYMAMVYRRKGEWEKSQELIKKVAALDPQEALYFTNIGMTYTYFHNYDSALIFHKKAIDVMPSWSSSYTNMIETLLLKGNIPEAKALLDTAINKTGRNFIELKILLNIYDRRYADALQEAEKSHKADFRIEGKKYLYIANINSYLKNFENAVIYYDSALVSFNNDLKNDKDNFEIHSCLGIAYAGKGDKANAINEGKKAVDLIKYNNFDKSDMILDLARIYTMTGEFDLAVNTIDYLMQTPMNIPCCFSIGLLQLDPVWEPLYNQPVYKTWLKKFTKN
jgi:serine/threonine-protein kinase